MKFTVIGPVFVAMLSHPLWGAWIEIALSKKIGTVFPVAPLVGCVD